MSKACLRHGKCELAALRSPNSIDRASARLCRGFGGDGRPKTGVAVSPAADAPGTFDRVSDACENMLALDPAGRRLLDDLRAFRNPGVFQFLCRQHERRRLELEHRDVGRLATGKG